MEWREETLAKGPVGFPHDLHCRQIALPEFKSKFADLGLTGDCAENEAAVGFKIIVAEKFAAAFEREIIRVRKFAVKRISLRIDVIGSVFRSFFRGAINHEHQMGQRVESALVVNTREGVEFGS